MYSVGTLKPGDTVKWLNKRVGVSGKVAEVTNGNEPDVYGLNEGGNRMFLCRLDQVVSAYRNGEEVPRGALEQGGRRSVKTTVVPAADETARKKDTVTVDLVNQPKEPSAGGGSSSDGLIQDGSVLSDGGPVQGNQAAPSSSKSKGGILSLHPDFLPQPTQQQHTKLVMR